MKFKKDYSRKSILKIEKNALSFVSSVKEDLLKFYDSSYSSLLLPSDVELFDSVSLLAERKKKYSHLVVVGIGGSNLGSLAVLEAVKGKHHVLNNFKKVFFADTVDPDNISSILNACENHEFLLLFISKSGTTVESFANFEFFLSKIPLSQRKDRVLTICDSDSVLANYSKVNNFDSLFIPKNVGGRFSVFSAVGLFPLAFAGVDIKELLRGASDAIKTFNKNSVALQGALDLYYNYSHGMIINDLFLFSNDLESLGKWYRQLMGESLGKRFNLQGREVFLGITPTVSIGSTDLHSLGQLYLGGPRDKFTSFVSLKNQTRVVVPKNKGAILKNLQGLSFNDIMGAILKGTMNAYKKNNLPFNHYELDKKSEYEIGFFMQTKMFEIMILAHLLNVNSFDQPSVEDYKVETRRLLGKAKK
jgi:glucose-6-phosphate isomerase